MTSWAYPGQGSWTDLLPSAWRKRAVHMALIPMDAKLQMMGNQNGTIKFCGHSKEDKLIGIQVLIPTYDSWADHVKFFEKLDMEYIEFEWSGKTEAIPERFTNPDELNDYEAVLMIADSPSHPVLGLRTYFKMEAASTLWKNPEGELKGN